MLLVLLAACSSEPELPIESGTYRFQHKFAEHPSMPSIEVTVVIDGRRVKIVNEQATDVFPKGTLAKGILLWHPDSRQWIIGKNKADREVSDVGGCSDGPEVIDLTDKVYWTC